MMAFLVYITDFNKKLEDVLYTSEDNILSSFVFKEFVGRFLFVVAATLEENSGKSMHILYSAVLGFKAEQQN